nr:MAG TPA: hypothetical protein [Caudoviricetes sp.]
MKKEKILLDRVLVGFFYLLCFGRMSWLNQKRLK